MLSQRFRVLDEKPSRNRSTIFRYQVYTCICSVLKLKTLERAGESQALQLSVLLSLFTLRVFQQLLCANSGNLIELVKHIYHLPCLVYRSLYVSLYDVSMYTLLGWFIVSWFTMILLIARSNQHPSCSSRFILKNVFLFIEQSITRIVV